MVVWFESKDIVGSKDLVWSKDLIEANSSVINLLEIKDNFKARDQVTCSMYEIKDDVKTKAGDQVTYSFWKKPVDHMIGLRAARDFVNLVIIILQLPPFLSTSSVK